MDTKKYKLRAEVALKPVWYQDPPEIQLLLNDQILFAGILDTDRTFYIEEMLSAGPACLTINFTNKFPSDTNIATGQDKAVIVEKITFNDIPSPRYVWAGLYYPQYNPDWYQQQVNQGHTPKSVLQYHNYLSWNGSWKLDVTLPIFTWIHKVESLGWIYN